MSAEHVARVEHGLVPEIRSAGEKGWSIAERLRAHRTPGVSIAVIDGYRVAWARAYGLADAGIGTPMQATTQLQATSVSKLATAVAALREVEGRGHEARASYARAKELVDRAPALSDHDELYVRARFAWLEQRGLDHDSGESTMGDGRRSGRLGVPLER